MAFYKQNIIYKSIYDLPAWNFDQINTKHDFSYLFKKYKKVAPNKRILKIWDNIYDEFIEAFGVSEYFVQYINCLIEALKFYKKAYIDNERHNVNFAILKEQEARDIYDMNNKTDKNIYARVSVFLGKPINPKQISTFEFYSLINLMKENASK